MELPLRGLAYVALVAIGAALLGALVNRAASRIGAQRIADGDWDENGPKHPTKPKPWEHVSSQGYIGLDLGDEPDDREQGELPPEEERREPSP